MSQVDDDDASKNRKKRAMFYAIPKFYTFLDASKHFEWMYVRSAPSALLISPYLQKKTEIDEIHEHQVKK